MQHQHTVNTELIDGWMAAFIANTRAVESHPMFPRLVREVAIAEAAASKRLAWIARNSPTFGSWINRPGLSHDLARQRRHCAYPLGRQRRAYIFARRIVNDLDHFSGWRLPEADAAVYVTARWHVQHRSSGRDL